MSDHDQQRRAVLRFALGTGCAMAVPAILAGCGNSQGPPAVSSSGNETATSEPAASPPAEGTSTATTGAQGAALVPKAQVKYQEQPKGEQQCSNCQHFVAATRTCQLVEGPVSPDGWCMLWVRKT